MKSPKDIAKIITEDPDYHLDDHLDDSGSGGALADKLNEGGVAPKVTHGNITLYSVETDGGVPWAEYGITEAYCQDHPDGMDRGGIVVVVKSNNGEAAFFHVASGWQETISE